MNKAKIKEEITKIVAQFLEKEEDDIFIAIDYKNGYNAITTYDSKTGEDIDADFSLKESYETSHGIEIEDYIEQLLNLLKHGKILTAETLERVKSEMIAEYNDAWLIECENKFYILER